MYKTCGKWILEYERAHLFLDFCWGSNYRNTS
ncbi:MAG TPA: hypothetical protein DEB70_08315 [Planctomycetaceae bacterium]|nr:hypothetical protein [Planctomycetaceae bacterium]